MKKITLKILRQTLEKIEHFHYAFNTITQQRSSGSIASHYSKYAILLTNAERHDDIQSVISSLLEGLKYRFPTYNEFKTGFENLTYTSMKSRNKNLIKYTLGKLLGNSSNGLSIDFTAMTLEHIMPEEQFKFGYFEEDIGKIGNLILVDRKTNNEELANLPFKEKMLLLNQKKYPLDTYVLSQDLWGKEQIDERTKLCIDEIYKKIMI